MRSTNLYISILSLFLCPSIIQAYKYATHLFKQRVDHFSFTNNDKFSQRYLVSNKYWNKEGGPILFYAGNEGDITLFAENTGLIWDIAPEFKALIIFAEHRYYGKSLPYGKNSFLNMTYTGYLTSEQALADYAALLLSIRTSVPGAAKSAIIAFGGSYGGMLAAWMRMKYPHIIQGAIAASAPILQFVGMTACDKFGQLVTKDFEMQSKECAQCIRKSWAAINEKAKTKEGLQWLTDNWKLCKPLKTSVEVELLKDYLTNVWTNLAMTDYPYPTSFLMPLPAHPVMITCNQLKKSEYEGSELLTELFNGISIYFNFTKTATCLDYGQSGDSRLGDVGWDFQACSEMVMPFCYDGKRDFFEPSPWNFTAFSTACYNRWRVMPRPVMPKMQYGGGDLQAASNIVFSNGLLDPWSTGGILRNVSSSVVAVIIPEGAHHLDLRHSDPNDPPSVIAARNLEKEMIRQWVKEREELEGETRAEL